MCRTLFYLVTFLIVFLIVVLIVFLITVFTEYSVLFCLAIPPVGPSRSGAYLGQCNMIYKMKLPVQYVEEAHVNTSI